MLSSGDARKPPAPATLAAGVLTTLDFAVLRAGKASCVVRWSFTPEADKTYLVPDRKVHDLKPAAVPPGLLRPRRRCRSWGCCRFSEIAIELPQF